MNYFIFIKISILFVITLLLITACSSSSKKDTKQAMQKEKSALLYVGTYTKKEGHVDGKAAGIYIFKMNAQTGQLTIIDTIKNTVNPSYLAVHPNEEYLYAVNEIAGNGNPPLGTVSAFRLDENGRYLQSLNTVSVQGDAPCHISIDQSRKYVLVANYMGSIASFPIQEDGSLGEAISAIKHELKEPIGGRQEAAHAHMITTGIDEKSVFVVDLGMDQVVHYQLEKGALQQVAITNLTPGAGGRHLDFHPTQKWVYVLGELNQTIEAFRYTNTVSSFERFQIISTLEKPILEGNIGPSAIHIHPSGKFLYAANRGIQGNKEQSIAMYKINQISGQLTFLGLQPTKGLVPRDFAIDPNGQFLLVANQNSDTIVTFRINPETGMLEETGIIMEVKTPVCLQFGHSTF